MRVELEPGKYVVAVSGGVDSVALLDILAGQPGVNLTVAHFDHGIRGDSHLDNRLVSQLAAKYKLPFVYSKVNLGAGASEDQARRARYDFLHQVQKAVGAEAIVTAHHQDDLIETAIINMIRGTGRRGITSLRDHRHLRRPMLHLPKADIKNYALDQGLTWREDSTNSDMTILRNYVRGSIVPRLGAKGRAELLNHIGHMSVVNRAVDNDLMVYLHLQPSRQVLDRHMFVQLPHNLSLEVMASWLRSHGISGYTSRQLEQIVARAKTLEPGKQIMLNGQYRILLGAEAIALVTG